MDEEQRGLLAAVWASPADQLPRLVYADWLDEHCEEGQPGWPRTERGTSLAAEYIRLRPGTDLAAVAQDRERLARLIAIEQTVASSILDPLLLRQVFSPVANSYTPDGKYKQAGGFGHAVTDLMPGYLDIGGNTSFWGKSLLLPRDEPAITLSNFLRVHDLTIGTPPANGLPPFLHVEGNLRIRGTAFRRLPDDIRV